MLQNVTVRSQTKLQTPIQIHKVFKRTTSQECVGIDIKKNMSCLVCNHSRPDDLTKEETIVCPHCKVTTLSSLLNYKLVCHVLIKTDKGMHSYTCFNDAAEHYLRKINHPVPLADMPIADLKFLLLKAGKQGMIADKTAKRIPQFP